MFTKSLRHHFIAANGMRFSVKGQTEKKALARLPKCINLASLTASGRKPTVN